MDVKTRWYSKCKEMGELTLCSTNHSEKARLPWHWYNKIGGLLKSLGICYKFSMMRRMLWALAIICQATEPFRFYTWCGLYWRTRRVMPFWCNNSGHEGKITQILQGHSICFLVIPSLGFKVQVGGAQNSLFSHIMRIWEWLRRCKWNRY